MNNEKNANHSNDNNKLVLKEFAHYHHPVTTGVNTCKLVVTEFQTLTEVLEREED